MECYQLCTIIVHVRTTLVSPPSLWIAVRFSPGPDHLVPIFEDDILSKFLYTYVSLFESHQGISD
jgi:hypothetical protein